MSGRIKGFTLIELMAVMFIVSLLAGISVASYYHSLVLAKENTLKNTLKVTRNALDDYYSDTGKYPNSLAVLKEKHYLRDIPFDPVVGAADRWRFDHADDGGIVDIHSTANGEGSDGTAFNVW